MEQALRKKALSLVVAQRDHQLSAGLMTSAWHRTDSWGFCAGILLLSAYGVSIRSCERCDYGAVDFDLERERQRPVANQIDNVAFALTVGLVELERLLHLQNEQEGR